LPRIRGFRGVDVLYKFTFLNFSQLLTYFCFVVGCYRLVVQWHDDSETWWDLGLLFTPPWDSITWTRSMRPSDSAGPRL